MTSLILRWKPCDQHPKAPTSAFTELPPDTVRSMGGSQRAFSAAGSLGKISSLPETWVPIYLKMKRLVVFI